MEILRDLEQIYNKLNIFLKIENLDLLKEQDFVFSIANPSTINLIAENSQLDELSEKEIDIICNLIFQLQDYVKIICNLTHLLLSTKKYNLVYFLVSKIFIGHIGNIVYRSSSAKLYTQRNLDRLIEIVKTAKIPPETYIPFLVEIYKTEKNDGYAHWKAPALEYLQNFWNDNEKWFLNFIKSNPEWRYRTLEAIIDFNTTKGIDFLIRDYVNKDQYDLEQNLTLMKKHKDDILFYIDTELLKADDLKQEVFVDVMLELDSSNEVMSRIKEIYNTTQNNNIKIKIANKMGIGETLNIKTEKQFLNAVRRKMKEPQERVLGIGFDKFNLCFASGYKADDAVYTFLIYLFKAEKNLLNITKLQILNKIFNQESLQEMAKILYDMLSAKEDINQSKWCVRLISLLCSKQLEREIGFFIQDLFKNGRIKEAFYFFECLIYSKKMGVLSILKNLIQQRVPEIIEQKNYYIKLIADTLNIDSDDLCDLIVPDEYTQIDYENQKNRLFNSFIAGKFYTKNHFEKLFISNPLFNKLAQGLVFGEYKFGRLNNAFIVENKEIKFLIGNTIYDKDEQKNVETYIGIIHPLDCDFKYEKIFNYHSIPTFNQFKKPKFNVADYNSSIMRINRFVGVVVNTVPFCEYLFKNNFYKNKLEGENGYISIIHKMPLLDLICEVEFEKKITDTTNYSSLSYVTFYKMSNTLVAQEKYITEKQLALAINSISYRYFDYVLSLLLEASKL